MKINYYENARYEYHTGSPWNTLEKSWAFNHKVQDLIYSQVITFDKPSLNVKKNHMPTHAGPLMNDVENFIDQELLKKWSR